MILLIAGLIPKFSALLRTIPQCVLGGAVASVFASIAMTGIKLLVTEKLTYRNTTVAGLSIAIGMGVSLNDGCLNQMSASIHNALNMSMSLESFQSIINNTFASSPVVLATIFAVILESDPAERQAGRRVESGDAGKGGESMSDIMRPMAFEQLLTGF